MQALHQKIGGSGSYTFSQFIVDPWSDSPPDLHLRLFTLEFLERFTRQRTRKYEHANTASKWPVALLRTKQRILLTKLQYGAQACCHVSAVAHFFGWKPTRSVEEWGHVIRLEQMLEVEAAGEAITTEFFSTMAEGRAWVKGSRFGGRWGRASGSRRCGWGLDSRR
ncbi:hypothetical protein B0H10DRAFT_1940343 [Mycena sp. CBHHK59/15]|nr:hypothetical protein B0H10DRAFT_1940343 [Mycena sp. CBHHK59/15]